MASESRTDGDPDYYSSIVFCSSIAGGIIEEILLRLSDLRFKRHGSLCYGDRAFLWGHIRRGGDSSSISPCSILISSGIRMAHPLCSQLQEQECQENKRGRKNHKRRQGIQREEDAAVLVATRVYLSKHLRSMQDSTELETIVCGCFPFIISRRPGRTHDGALAVELRDRHYPSASFLVFSPGGARDTNLRQFSRFLQYPRQGLVDVLL